LAVLLCHSEFVKAAAMPLRLDPELRGIEAEL
jgi:hypothetical protein